MATVGEPLAARVYSEVQGEIITAQDGTITIGNMQKLVNTVGAVENKAKISQVEAISDLAQDLIKVSTDPKKANESLGELATGVSNMAVAKQLNFSTIVDLKLAGKQMRGINVSGFETLKSYLSAALVWLGFGVEAATKIEKAKTPDDKKKVLADVAKANPNKGLVVDKLNRAETPEAVKKVVAEAVKQPIEQPATPAVLGRPTRPAPRPPATPTPAAKPPEGPKPEEIKKSPERLQEEITEGVGVQEEVPSTETKVLLRRGPTSSPTTAPTVEQKPAQGPRVRIRPVPFPKAEEPEFAKQKLDITQREETLHTQLLEGLEEISKGEGYPSEEWIKDNLEKAGGVYDLVLKGKTKQELKDAAYSFIDDRKSAEVAAKFLNDVCKRAASEKNFRSYLQILDGLMQAMEETPNDPVMGLIQEAKDSGLLDVLALKWLEGKKIRERK